MANEVTTVDMGVTFRRTSKTGKVTVRGALGVIMSGNASERASEALMITESLLKGNTFTPIMFEVVRVFAPKTLAKHGVYEVGDSFAIYVDKTITPITGQWNMTTSRLYADAVLARCEALEESGKEIKGEKATVRDMCQLVVDYCEEKAQAKLAAMVAADAAAKVTA